MFCLKICANFEITSSLVLCMGGKDDPGIGIWMACMNSCKAFVADSEDEVKFIL